MTYAAAHAVRPLLPVWYHSIMALTVRTDPELENALKALCESENLSRQEVIRRAVLDRFEVSVHRQRVKSATDVAIERWSDVLDRLGSA